MAQVAVGADLDLYVAAKLYAQLPDARGQVLRDLRHPLRRPVLARDVVDEPHHRDVAVVQCPNDVWPHVGFADDHLRMVGSRLCDGGLDDSVELGD